MDFVSNNSSSDSKTFLHFIVFSGSPTAAHRPLHVLRYCSVGIHAWVTSMYICQQPLVKEKLEKVHRLAVYSGTHAQFLQATVMFFQSNSRSMDSMKPTSQLANQWPPEQNLALPPLDFSPKVIYFCVDFFCQPL